MRIGNGAYNQLQLDIYGELMDAIYLSNKYGDGISLRWLADLQQHPRVASQELERPDEGIWEVRGGRREFLHSRLMCWVAFDRAIRLGGEALAGRPVREWQEIRDDIYEDISHQLLDDVRKAFVQYQGLESLDASVLLMPLMRFISPTDPRWLSTLDAIEKTLTEDSHCLSVRQHQNSPSMDCAAAKAVLPHARSGLSSAWPARIRLEKARLLFDKMLGYANHLGLYSEQLGSSGEAPRELPAGIHASGADQRRNCSRSRFERKEQRNLAVTGRRILTLGVGAYPEPEARRVGRRLSCQQNHAHTNTQRSQPPPLIDIFFQEELARDRIRHHRQRSGSRRHQAEVGMA